jgi:hypothetical protein
MSKNRESGGQAMLKLFAVLLEEPHAEMMNFIESGAVIGRLFVADSFDHSAATFCGLIHCWQLETWQRVGNGTRMKSPTLIAPASALPYNPISTRSRAERRLANHPAIYGGTS